MSTLPWFRRHTTSAPRATTSPSSRPLPSATATTISSYNLVSNVWARLKSNSWARPSRFTSRLTMELRIISSSLKAMTPRVILRVLLVSFPPSFRFSFVLFITIALFYSFTVWKLSRFLVSWMFTLCFRGSTDDVRDIYRRAEGQELVVEGLREGQTLAQEWDTFFLAWGFFQFLLFFQGKDGVYFKSLVY